MESLFPAGRVNRFMRDVLRHYLTFAGNRGWRYTPAGFNFIILALELTSTALAMRALEASFYQQ